VPSTSKAATRPREVYICLRIEIRAGLQTGPVEGRKGGERERERGNKSERGKERRR